MSALYLTTTDTKFIGAISDIEIFNHLLSKYLKKNTLNKKQKRKYDWFYTKTYKKIKKIILAPSAKAIKKHLLDPTVLFLSWEEPSPELIDVLVVKELPLINGILTMQEEDFDVKDFESLEQKLGLEVKETSRSFKDLIGADFQKEVISDMFYSLDKKRLKKLTMFLLGIPGAGKTYFAECIAGEHKRMLIKLDLSRLMQMDRPILKWHKFLKWAEMLHYQGIHFIGLFDEIATALKGGNYIQEQFAQQILTTIEDLNTERGYHVGSSMFIGTDNNIRKIMDETPQFMARFEEKFFFNFPKEKEAQSMLYSYFKQYGVKYRRGQELSWDELENIYEVIKSHFLSKQIEYDGDANRFIYAPREIDKFASKLATISERFFENNSEEEALTQDRILACCNRLPPQQEMLRIGITKMINDAGSGFVEI